MPLISIIVPAFNEEKLLATTLDVIKAAADAMHQAGFATEIVVCDNNSTDATAQIARDAGAIVVFEPVNQIARARNRGASAALGDWLVFIDADSHPSKALFAETAAAMADPTLVAGGTTIAATSGTAAYRLGARIWNRLSRWMRWAAGAYVFCRREAFQNVGGFNEELYASEEIELFNKLKRHARRTRGHIRILAEPLETSDRKLKLYSTGELFSFMTRALFLHRATIRNRDACRIWYDGRR